VEEEEKSLPTASFDEPLGRQLGAERLPSIILRAGGRTVRFTKGRRRGSSSLALLKGGEEAAGKPRRRWVNKAA
jgi:hypothetical protein